MNFNNPAEINTERVPLDNRTDTEGKRKAKGKSPKITDCFRSVSADEISRFSAPFVPMTTNHSTAWAKSTFDSWNDSRGEDKCPNSFLDGC